LLASHNKGNPEAENFSLMRALFVTGPGRKVGKTVVSAAIASALRHKGLTVGFMKPVAFDCLLRDGETHCPDINFLEAVNQRHDPLTLVAPFRFQGQPTPPLAGHTDQKETFIPDIISRFFVLLGAFDFVLVEGPGDLKLPLTSSNDVRDMIGWLRLPTLVVAPVNTGHKEESLELLSQLKEKKLELAGVVFNQLMPDAPWPRWREKAAEDPSTYLGYLPFLTGISVDKLHSSGFDPAELEQLHIEALLQMKPHEATTFANS
jgi:dethiobiotin synthetase